MRNESSMLDASSVVRFNAERALRAPADGAPRPGAAPGLLRIAVVDDDHAVRMQIVRLLQGMADVEIVGEGQTSDELASIVTATAPDLIVVAMRASGMNGLKALSDLRPERRPPAIVVADGESFACQAFEAQALDYLAGALTAERVDRAIERARWLLGPADRRRGPGPRGLVPTTGRPSRLVVKSPGQLTFVELREIDRIEAAGNYVRVHAGAEVHLMRGTIKHVEARLDSRFIRVHRCTIVNADRIKRISSDDDGHPWVVLRDGTRISAGRYLEAPLREWMSNAL